MLSVSTVAAALQPWADRYGTTPVLETGVTFAHFAGLLVGGGFALATDRMTLRCCSVDSAATERISLLEQIGSIHRPVLWALGVTAASGLLMLGADFEALWVAPRFWVKMALIVLLMVNGLAMTRVETTLRRNPHEGNAAWRRLHLYSVTSFGLWLLITLAGVWLTNG